MLLSSVRLHLQVTDREIKGYEAAIVVHINMMSGAKGQNPIVLAQRGLRPWDPQNTSK